MVPCRNGSMDEGVDEISARGWEKLTRALTGKTRLVGLILRGDPANT
jgi:hypothetical protein